MPFWSATSDWCSTSASASTTASSRAARRRTPTFWSASTGCSPTITYEQQLQLKLGLPTVQYCADRLCLSPNYFGDVVKRTTGDTASNHIRRFVIRLAKNGLSAGESVAQVADRLGFEYPQHFSRMFRRQEGITPSEYSRKRQW
ncbi:helix-turn-helix domain-containing protein [Alistipes sp. Marseille-P5061]|uniref:helix-turn-helix domain-containing protein n=1 Tax=Alistipes sp. Marseille-P5061 TaxID=2048242 RepID=UPI0032078951